MAPMCCLRRIRDALAGTPGGHPLPAQALRSVHTAPMEKRRVAPTRTSAPKILVDELVIGKPAAATITAAAAIPNQPAPLGDMGSKCSVSDWTGSGISGATRSRVLWGTFYGIAC